MSFTNLLNIEIVIQSRTNAGSNYKPSYTWSTYATVDARKTKIKESVQPRNEGNISLADYTFYCNYTSGVTNQMRINYNSEYYNIYDVNDIDEMNHHLEIRTKKQQPGAENERQS